MYVTVAVFYSQQQSKDREKYKIWEVKMDFLQEC